MTAESDGLVWAADYLETWGKHFVGVERRRITEWLVYAVRTEAVRVRDGLPDTPDARREAQRRLEGLLPMPACSWHPGEWHGICSEAD